MLNDLLARIPHTKDGKPILWGDKVYYPDPDVATYSHFEDVHEIEVHSITIGTSFEEYIGTHTILAGDFEFGNLECYSQRAAVPLDEC
jgi:hypothetical protein